MSHKADLSVIVTSFNKPHDQLVECMQSIKDQTIKPKEIILVDDCSDDPRAHALAVSIMLPQNVGTAKARDVGVRFSTGKLLLFLDADDKLSPDFIQQCGKVITKADIAYPNMILFGAVETNILQESPSKITPQYLTGNDCRIPVTSMIHRKMYDKLGGFNPSLPVFEDWDFWIRAAFNGYTFKKANTLLWYRQNHSSRNHASRDTKSRIHSLITAKYKEAIGTT